MKQIGKTMLRLSFAPLLLAGAMISHAGDPIVFSGKAIQTDPAKTDKFDKEVSKGERRTLSGSANTPLPLDGIVPHNSGGGRPDKLTAREKNMKIEKENWLLFDPGDLTDATEEELAEQEAMDPFHTEDQGADYTFRNLGKALNPGKGKNNAGRGKQPQTSVRADDEDGLGRNRDNSRAPLSSAHTSSEMDLKGLFKPSQADRTSVKAELSLSDVFKSSAAPGLSKSQQALRDDFNAFLNGGPSGNTLALTPQPGALEPIGSQSDFNRAPLMNTPLTARPETAPRTDLSPASPAFSRGPSVGPSPFAATPPPTWQSGRPATPGVFGSSAFAPQEPSRAPSQSPTLTIPTRPGMRTAR